MTEYTDQEMKEMLQAWRAPDGTIAINEFNWRVENGLAIFKEKYFNSEDRYDERSIITAIDNIKKERSFYTDEAYHRQIRKYETGLAMLKSTMNTP